MYLGEYLNNGPSIVLVPVAGNDGKQSWLACNGNLYANVNAHTHTRKEDDLNIDCPTSSSNTNLIDTCVTNKYRAPLTAKRVARQCTGTDPELLTGSFVMGVQEACAEKTLKTA